MLSREHRLVESEDFKRARRFGVKAGNRFLVVTIAVSEEDAAISHVLEPGGARVGFIIPRSQLPRAVDRNRVRRQLRHLMRSRVAEYSDGTLIVIRVLSACKGKDSEFLAAELDSMLRGAKKKLDRGKQK